MLIFTLIGGLTYPNLCSVLAATYMLGRLIYSLGYLSYPKGRKKGLVLMNFSALPMMVIAVMSSYNLIK